MSNDIREHMDVTQYEVVKAKTVVEAMEASQFRVGQEAFVREIKYFANGDGTFTVKPMFRMTGRMFPFEENQDGDERSSETK